MLARHPQAGCPLPAQVPKKLVVISGGYIGLEFASKFRALCSELEVFIRGPGLLRGFDKEVGPSFILYCVKLTPGSRPAARLRQGGGAICRAHG